MRLAQCILCLPPIRVVVFPRGKRPAFLVYLSLYGEARGVGVSRGARPGRTICENVHANEKPTRSLGAHGVCVVRAPRGKTNFL